MAAKTEAGYIDGYVSDDGKIGLEVHGEEAVKLNAPFVYLSDDTPLLTTAQDLAGAINELFQGDSGGGDEKDADYAKWESLTEPEKNQFIMVVRVFNTDNRTATLLVQRSSYYNNINRTFYNWTVDWGDGVIENIDATSKNSFNHTYTILGDYVVTVVCNDDIPDGFSTSAIIANRLNIFSPYMVSVKFGTFGTLRLNDFGYLKYVKINPNNINELGDFSGDISLKQVIAKISSYSMNFSNCINLSFDKIEFGSITEISNEAFDNCTRLTGVKFPNCTKIGNYAFRNCINLQSAEFAENCAISSGAFTGCAKLYPHPDGTTY